MIKERNKTLVVGLFSMMVYGVIIMYCMSSCGRREHIDRQVEIPTNYIESKVIEVKGSNGDIKVFTFDGMKYIIYESHLQRTSPILLRKDYI